MTHNEAINLATILKGLMPRMTDELVKAVAHELLNADAPHGRAVIDQYARSATDFVLADFMKVLRPAPPIQEASTPFGRTRLMQEQERRDAAAAAREREEIDGVIESMTPAELEAHRQAVLEEIGTPHRARWENKDVKSSRMLKVMIFNRIRASGGVIA